MFGSKFDYLRLNPKTVEELYQDGMYIKEGQEVTAYRRIYQGVEFENFEKKHISKFKDILRERNISIKDDDILLRYLYAGYFNPTNSLELYRRHIAWLNACQLNNVPDNVLHYLKEGLVYIGGRDYQYRPILVVNLHLLDLYLFDSDAFIQACSILLVICEDYLFYPGKVENIVVIVEANQMSINNFPLRSFQVVLWMLSQNFPQVLDRLYIFNPSKEILNTWEHYSYYIDARTLKKIEMWDSKSFSPLAHGFHPDMFEQKFGGSMPDIQQYWLPVQIIQQPSGVKYKITKPPPMTGQVQYSLYNDPEELMERLKKRDQEDGIYSKESSKNSVIQHKPKKQPTQGLDLHQPMGDMFGTNKNKQQYLGSHKQLLDQDMSQSDHQSQVSIGQKHDIYKTGGFQGKSGIEQPFRSHVNFKSQEQLESERPSKSMNNMDKQYAQTYQPNKKQQQQQQQQSQTVGGNVGAPPQSNKILESFDDQLNQSGARPSDNVQACIMM